MISLGIKFTIHARAGFSGDIIETRIAMHCDVITKVDKEYHILSEITEKRAVPVPQPLYRSRAEDRQVAGVDFIIMSFVEV